MVSAICFNFDQSNILSFGNGLTINVTPSPLYNPLEKKETINFYFVEITPLKKVMSIKDLAVSVKFNQQQSEVKRKELLFFCL